MRAAVFAEHGGPEVVRIEDVPVPEPGPGEVRLRVRAASLNHLDLWVRRGLPVETTMPHIGGADVAGEVQAVGPGVDPSWLGARVVADPALDYDWYERGTRSGDGRRFRLLGEHTQGSLAELCVVPASNLVRLPAGFSYETAAAAGLVSVTAWHALVTRGALQAGETVLITGASGGVATMAIQIAGLLGARVLAVTSGSENVARVRALGAAVVYDRLKVDYARAVWSETRKRGVDVVLDSVGQALWTSNMRALAVRGRLVSYGATTGSKAETDLAQLFWKQLSILGTTMGSPDEFRTVMGLVFEEKLRPVIHEVLPLDQARRAHELLERGEVFGKLVLIP
jgi:NADPH:quinone reductase-like Zn-dependent oxidoreductase